jgi:signal transduction histidine kinase
LFIAREIVLAHGGTIRASSSAEDGTVFTVELPCANHNRAVAETAPPPEKLRVAAASD